MKKKSVIFALIAVVCIAIALYFMRSETLDEQPEEIEIDPEEIDPEYEDQPTVKRRSKKEKEVEPLKVVPDEQPGTTEQPKEDQ